MPGAAPRKCCCSSASPALFMLSAAKNYRITIQSGLDVRPFTSIETLTQQLATADWVVDALFGTGLAGPVKSPYDDIIECINQSGAKILAVDLPSGLDADTGQSLG